MGEESVPKGDSAESGEPTILSGVGVWSAVRYYLPPQHYIGLIASYNMLCEQFSQQTIDASKRRRNGTRICKPYRCSWPLGPIYSLSFVSTVADCSHFWHVHGYFMRCKDQALISQGPVMPMTFSSHCFCHYLPSFKH